MKNKTSLSLVSLLLLFTLLSGCKDDEFSDDLETTNSNNEIFYEENNEIATKRLSTIMYNDSNTPDTYERFKIVHISDPHLSSQSLSNNYKKPINLLQSVKFANQQELKINAMVATGDFISNGEKKDAIQYMESFISNFRQENHIPFLLCTGNHDCNDIDFIPNSFIYNDEINNILFSSTNNKHQNGTKNYYYEDIPNPQGGTIRFISLDMLDQPSDEYNTMIYASFSQEQINWLGEIALQENMTDQHSVIVLVHYPFIENSGSLESTYLCDGDFVHAWFMIPEIIETYRSRSAIKKEYLNRLSPEKTISADFNFHKSKGEFICYLGGHAHCTANFEIKGYPFENKSLMPQKMLLCTNQSPSEKGHVYNRVLREENSVSSNSFCIYAIDTKEKKIYVTFFGAYKPSDKENYAEIQTISYQ